MLQCAAPTKWTASLIHMAREPLFGRELVFIYNDDVHTYTYVRMHLRMCSIWAHAMVRPTSPRVDLGQLSNCPSTLAYTYIRIVRHQLCT